MLQHVIRRTMVDLAGGLSKPAPPLVHMGSLHRTIRARAPRPTQIGLALVRSQRRISDETLDALEARYRAGETLRVIANDVGLSRQRLAPLLRDRGVRIRRATPSSSEVREMVRRYGGGESLERVGASLEFSAGTVRNHLIAAGVVLRDPQGRER